MTIRQKNLFINSAAVLVVGALTACGGDGGNKNTISSKANQLSSSSSIVAVTSSSSLAVRREIPISKDIFYKEPGLWLAFTHLEATQRFPQNDVQKPFMEERLRETSINTYVFASESESVAPGVCVLTPAAFDETGLLPLFISSELYCTTSNRFFHESDNSYTMEYRCENELVMTTRIVKLSDQNRFQDLGLTLNDTQVQQPACASWNISTFETWFLDKDGKEIERAGRAAMLNKIFIRVGVDNNSRVIAFTRYEDPFSVGIFNITPAGASQLLLRNVEAQVSSPNSSIPFIPGVHFAAQKGELRIDTFTPLSLSGSFNMEDTLGGGSLGGNFSFDFRHYFKEVPTPE
ncbi:hypothetical protein [Cellvibrio mixtus]|uniref:hypothetical protein n=1 Tax=Cellvibrio mixtus TaxID=39650 RepID=UPI000586B3B3|nr:hypothetical protein [Cellvibrio mixtus]